jgi:hypothetical protein
MSFESDSALFRTSSDGCGSQFADGRLILAPLVNCGDSPIVYTLVPAVTAINATSVNVTVTGATATTTVYLMKGRVIQFGAVSAVVATTTKLVGVAAQPVPVEPLTAALTAADVATVFSALEVISLSNMPIDYQSQTESSDKLRDGTQSDMDVTKISAQSAIEGFIRSDDAGFWTQGFGFTSATGILSLYGIMTTASDKIHHWGKLQFHGLQMPNQAASLKKFTSTIQWKPPYYPAGHADYATTAQKTALNNVRTLFGLAAIA